MNYRTLDNDELLRLALGAMNADRDAEAMDLLKTLLEREPGQGQAQYLLAALHAELGMMDRAEPGFRAALQAMPELVVARFQLGQLLVLQGRNDEARDALAPLAESTAGDALGAYARALRAVAADDAAGAIAELQAGLAAPQEIPALAGDMQRLLERLREADPAAAAGPAAPLFLSGYGRS